MSTIFKTGLKALSTGVTAVVFAVVSTAAQEPAPSRAWVRAYVASNCVSSSTANGISTATNVPAMFRETFSAPFTNGTEVGTLSMALLSPTNIILECVESDCSLVTNTSKWVYDTSLARYRSVDTPVWVRVDPVIKISVVTNMSMRGASVVTNLHETKMFYAEYGTTNFYPTMEGGDTWLIGRGVGKFRVRNRLVSDAEYAALRATNNVVSASLLSWNPFLAYGAITKYELSPTPTAGLIAESLYIGEITYTKDNGSEFKFNGGGYTPLALDIDVSEDAKTCAAAIVKKYMDYETASYGDDITSYWDELDKDGSLMEDISEPSYWGLNFPLVDDNGTTITKTRFKESATWKEAVKKAYETLKSAFRSNVNANLALLNAVDAPHECPQLPEGRDHWTPDLECKCYYVSAAKVTWDISSETKGSTDAASCAYANVSQHIWNYYKYDNGTLVLSTNTNGCKLCSRCGEQDPEHGAEHFMDPDNTEEECCYCHYYYTEKIEESHPQVTEPEEEIEPEIDVEDIENVEEVDEGEEVDIMIEDVTHEETAIETTKEEAEQASDDGETTFEIKDQNDQKHYYVINTTTRTNKYEQTIKNRMFLLTLKRHDHYYRIKASLAMLKDWDKRHEHRYDEGDCMCNICGHHRFLESRCEGVCAKCWKRQTTEIITKTVTVNDINIKFSDYRLFFTKEEEHTPIMTADWSNYDEETGDTTYTPIPEECGCGCGKYRGMYIPKSVGFEPYGATQVHAKFRREDFCNYRPGVSKLTQLGLNLGEPSMTNMYLRCKCWCRKNGNRYARAHVHRAGDLCHVRCMDCGLDYDCHEAVEYDWKSGIGTTVYRYDTEPLDVTNAALRHLPLTLHDIESWGRMYPTSNTFMTRHTIADFEEFFGCGCKCSEYSGGWYDFDKYRGKNQTMFDTMKKYHIRFDEDKCGCACSPFSHLEFIAKTNRLDGCPEVCGYCAQYGKNGEKITADNYEKYHTLPASDVTRILDYDYLQTVCGCACILSSNPKVLENAKQFKYDLYESGRMNVEDIKKFHFYWGATNSVECFATNDIGKGINHSCVCKCTYGPHNFVGSFFDGEKVCPNICHDCDGKMENEAPWIISNEERPEGAYKGYDVPTISGDEEKFAQIHEADPEKKCVCKGNKYSANGWHEESLLPKWDESGEWVVDHSETCTNCTETFNVVKKKATCLRCESEYEAHPETWIFKNAHSCTGTETNALHTLTTVIVCPNCAERRVFIEKHTIAQDETKEAKYGENGMVCPACGHPNGGGSITGGGSTGGGGSIDDL